MNSEKKVSIILTTFNSSKYVGDTIESILKQTYKNFELIIIDDCSNDNIFYKLKKYQFNNSKIRIFKTKKNSQTASLPRNLGLKKAKFDIICFIDDDDIWDKNKLSEQIKLIKKYNLIFSSTIYFYNNKKESNFLLNYFRTFFQIIFSFLIMRNNNFFYIYNPIVFSSVMIKKKLLINNPFNQHKIIAGIEDLELWVRIFKNKRIKPFFIKKALVKNKRNKNSLHSDYNIQIIKIIYLQCIEYIKLKKIRQINFFLFSVGIRVIRNLVKVLNNFFINKIYKIIFLIIFAIYTLNYSPLFKYVGNKYLTITDEIIENQDLAIIYSGPGYDKYYQYGYYYRYLELIKYKEFFRDKNILILYNQEKSIDVKTIYELLVKEGFDPKRIYLIEFNIKSFQSLKNFLEKFELKKIVIFTSQYESYFTKKIFKKNFIDLDIILPKQLDYFDHNYYIFERFDYKKIVMYNLINRAKLHLNIY